MSPSARTARGHRQGTGRSASLGRRALAAALFTVGALGASAPPPTEGASAAGAASNLGARHPVLAPAPASGGTMGRRQRMVRVALALGVASAPVSATARWTIAEAGSGQVIGRGVGGESWQVEARGGRLRVLADSAPLGSWTRGPLVARVRETDGFVQYRGHRYRGDVWFLATGDGVLVVNRLPMEAYLRGVVPVELGTRASDDRAALEAQAIAARSYAMVRVPRDEATGRRGWHLRAGVADQAYGGVDAEYPLASAAVEATAGLVLRFEGRIISAPYSAACGGRTAAPAEAWEAAPDAPFLRPVDDHDPATGRAWCDIAPQGRWTRELDATVLSDAVRRTLVPAQDGAEGATVTSAAWIPVRDVRVASRGRSGRIGTLVVTTDAGEVPVRAAALRAWLLRTRRATLASTFFSVEGATVADGRVASIRVRGVGHGHGVGMCQWGAIGRARAGQDARSILEHYYPGTVVGPAD